jgi:hypothetical protein
MKDIASSAAPNQSHCERSVSGSLISPSPAAPGALVVNRRLAKQLSSHGICRSPEEPRGAPGPAEAHARSLVASRPFLRALVVSSLSFLRLQPASTTATYCAVSAAIRARLGLIGKERGCSTSEMKLASRDVARSFGSDNELPMFAQRHNISMDWLLMGDLRALRLTVNPRKIALVRA